MSGRDFMRDEDGAVTVDWVPLMTAILLLSLAVLGAVSTGAVTAADGVSDYLSEVPLGTEETVADSGDGGGGDSSPVIDRGGRGNDGSGIVRISGRVGR